MHSKLNETGLPVSYSKKEFESNYGLKGFSNVCNSDRREDLILFDRTSRVKFYKNNIPSRIFAE